MTTDDFTTAARTEADRRMRADGLVTQASMVRAHGFTVGAEWARDHLAAQEPTDAEVEAVAGVLAESEDTGSVETARAALSAARKARP